MPKYRVIACEYLVMKVQFLFATMGSRLQRKNADVLLGLGYYLIVDQCPDGERPLGFEGIENTHTYREVGLSQSRNRALELTDADVAYICDDDLRFVDGARERVIAAYRARPEADIVIFNLTSSAGRKISANKRLPFRIGLMCSLLGVWSCMVSYKPSAVREVNVRFDERFGLGSRFGTGEEVIFLVDCLRRGLRIEFVDEAIAIHPKHSSGNRLDSVEALQAKGALFPRVFPVTHRFWAFFAAVRLWPMYRKRFGFLAALCAMFRGSREFRQLDLANPIPNK